MPNHPPIHVLNFGDYGAGKSTFAASFPTDPPQIVFSFDAYGKEMPYLRGGDVSDLMSDDRADFFREVHRRGKLIRRIEYYHDNIWIDPTEIKRKAGVSIKSMTPTAFKRFLTRMAKFQYEYDQWGTVIGDSVTSMEICARRWDQYVLNPGAEDARQWYGASKDMLEQMLMQRFAGLPMNVVVLAHVDDEKYEFQGVQRRMPMAPGKLRGALGSQYPEVYHQYVNKDGEYELQTRSDGVWACMTTIGAPNPCVPHYLKLWEVQ